MKTEGTLIYHKITVATGLLQNNAYGHELVVFCLIIPCVHCLLIVILNVKGVHSKSPVFLNSLLSHKKGNSS